AAGRPAGPAADARPGRHAAPDVLAAAGAGRDRRGVRGHLPGGTRIRCRHAGVGPAVGRGGRGAAHVLARAGEPRGHRGGGHLPVRGRRGGGRGVPRIPRSGEPGRFSRRGRWPGRARDLPVVSILTCEIAGPICHSGISSQVGVRSQVQLEVEVYRVSCCSRPRTGIALRPVNYTDAVHESRYRVARSGIRRRERGADPQLEGANVADHTRGPESSSAGTEAESLFGITDEATQASFDEVQPGLFPVDGIPDGTSGYRVPIACQIAGITYRQLDYWARTDLVVPSIRNAAGSGSQRLYSFKDILVLKIVKQLLDTGISLQNIRKAVDQIRSRGVQDLATITLFSDGRTVFECTSKE